MVFDDKGNLIRTIDKSRDVEEVPDRARLHLTSIRPQRGVLRYDLFTV